MRFQPVATLRAVAALPPFLPIAIEGTNDALHEHGFALRGRHDIAVTVLPPFEPGPSVPSATEQARARIADVVG